MNNKYTLIKEEYIEDIKSNVRLLKHNKSGARVLLIPCSDNNKTFTIGFRTPPINDTGVPHIMEHSTLCGSCKFPVKDPFVELLKSSLNTFLNAMTYPDKTIYPIASCNDLDFKNLMEVYMDAVFYPNVYLHEEIFKQEGWHYELDSLDSEIKLNGVVYNEMKGAFSNVDEVVNRGAMHALFPDTTYGVESGGDPEAIPNLSYEEFKAFHKKYYSPANSYIVLYGNCDMEERLDWMDKEYLSKFDIVDVNSTINFQTPFTKIKEEKILYSIGKDEDKTNKTQYSYSTVIGTYKDLTLSYAFQVLDYVLLDAPGAPLKEALLKNFGTSVSSSYDDGILQPVLMISVKGAKENKLEEFKSIINNTLKQIIHDGLDKKALKASLNSISFKLREADYGRFPKGLVYTTEALSSWLYDEDEVFTRLKFNSIITSLEKLIETNYFETLIKEYLIDNTHTSYLEVSPSNTLASEKDQALKEKLAQYKNSLSLKEQEQLIKDTLSLKEYQQAKDKAEDLDKLPKLSRSDISREAHDIYNKEEEYDSIKIIKHDIETNGIGYLDFLFKFDLASDELFKMMLTLEELGELSTKNYTYSELDKEIDIHTGGIDITFMTQKDASFDTMMFAKVSVKYLYGKEKEAISLVQEIITNTLFDDINKIKENISDVRETLANTIMARGHNSASNRVLSYMDKEAYIMELVQGLDYLDGYNELLKDFDNKINDLTKDFKYYMSYIFRKENLIISYTGKSDDYKQYLSIFKDSLYTSKINNTHFTYLPNALNEGIKSPSRVNYVARGGMYNPELFSGAISVFGVALRYDYLWNQVRVLGGAYGVMSNIKATGEGMFVSYRDPNLKRTSDVFDGILDYLDNFNPTEEQLTNYVIAAIGAEDSPYTPRQEGNVSLMRYFRGTTKEKLQKYRDEILNASISSIKALRPIYEAILNNKNICVFGNESKIEEDKDLFKTTRNLNK